MFYYVVAREDIYEDGDDFQWFLSVLKDVCELYNWVSHRDCLMTNHSLIEAPDANLSKGMLFIRKNLMALTIG